MEIDDKLKNRLAGTAVVTVLAVIFLPMLFDSPTDKKAQVVSELDIPHKPEVSPLLTTAIVPDKKPEVAKQTKPTATTGKVEPIETLANNGEKTSTEADTENTPQDATVEEENSGSVKKKSHKKIAIVDDSVQEKPAKQKILAKADEEKSTPKVAKTSSKSELPVLDENDQDKKKALPSLDSSPALEKHRWTVQVASLSDETKATAFRDKLRSQGFPATVDSVWLKGKGRVYRLRVGPELDAAKAQATKAKINQLNNVNSIAVAE